MRSQARAASMSDFRNGSKAPFWLSAGHFWSTPMSRHSQCPTACLKRAMNGHVANVRQHAGNYVRKLSDSARIQ